MLVPFFRAEEDGVDGLDADSAAAEDEAEDDRGAVFFALAGAGRARSAAGRLSVGGGGGLGRSISDRASSAWAVLWLRGRCFSIGFGRRGGPSSTTGDGGIGAPAPALASSPLWLR